MSYFKMTDAIAVFFNVNVMEIKLRRIKAYIKKNILHVCKVWIDKSVQGVAFASDLRR